LDRYFKADRRGKFRFALLCGPPADVREDLPVALDARGHARVTAMVYVPKSEASLDYKVEVDIASSNGKPSARIVSMQRVKAE